MAVENISGSDVVTTEFVRNSQRASETVEKDTREVVEKPELPRDESRGKNIDLTA